MKKINITQLKAAVKHLVIRMDRPVLVRGAFGIGKSQGIEQAATELDSPEALQALLGADCPYVGVELTEIRLSQYDSVDLRGFPANDKKTGTAIWYPPATFPFVGNDRFADDKLHLVLFDEAPDAKPDVFAVMQQLVLNRCVGEHVLKPNVRIVLAGNRLEDQGLAKKFPMPLNNRLIHFEVINTVDEFCLYARSVGVPSLFIGYWQYRQEFVNTYDPAKQQPVIATPRTWFTAVDLWQDKQLDPVLKEAAIIGAVGEGPAVDFFAYVDVWQKLPDIKKILEKPDTFPVPPATELGIRYATAMYVSDKMTHATIEKLHTYLTRFPPEFVVMAWTMAVARDPSLSDADAFMDFVRRFRTVYTSS